MHKKTSQSIFLHTIHDIGLRVETGVALERKMCQTPRFTGINEFGTKRYREMCVLVFFRFCLLFFVITRVRGNIVFDVIIYCCITNVLEQKKLCYYFFFFV